VVDWGLRHFHGFELSTHRRLHVQRVTFRRDDKTRGSRHTVWGPSAGSSSRTSASWLDPAKIDYVVANTRNRPTRSVFPTHALAPNATLVCSRKGAESIPGHHHQDWPTKVVKTGDAISLGSKSLVFSTAPMLHWPTACSRT